MMLKSLARLTIILALLFFDLPILWLLATAFKARSDITSVPPMIFAPPTTRNFHDLFLDHHILRLALNSTVAGVGVMVLTIALALPSGFYLYRSRRSKASRWLLFLLSTKMVPAVAISLPLFILLTIGNLRGRLGGLVLAQTVSSLPLAIWLLAAFFSDLPLEIYWAGQLDGRSPGDSLLRLVFPVAAPAIAATCLFVFIYSWNDYILAALITSELSRTLNAELPILVTQGVTQWGQLAAGMLLAATPSLISALLLRRYLLDGLTAGALKKI